MKQSIHLRIQFIDKMEDISCTTENRCRKSSSMKVQKKIEIPLLHLAEFAMWSKIEDTTLENFRKARYNFNQAAVMSVNGTARAWSFQYERRNISTASITNAMEMQTEAERRKLEEISQSEEDEQDNIYSARGKATRLRQR